MSFALKNAITGRKPRPGGIHHDTLYGRLRRGDSIRRGLTVPVRGRSE